MFARRMTHSQTSTPPLSQAWGNSPARAERVVGGGQSNEPDRGAQSKWQRRPRPDGQPKVRNDPSFVEWDRRPVQPLYAPVGTLLRGSVERPFQGGHHPGARGRQMQPSPGAVQASSDGQPTARVLLLDPPTCQLLEL